MISTPEKFTYPAILILQVLFLCVSSGKAQPSTGNNLLELDKADSVRILLYDAAPPGSVVISPRNSTVSLYFENNKIRLPAGSAGADISTSNGRVIIKHGSTKQSVDSLRLESDDIIQVHTKKFGRKFYHGSLLITPDRERDNLRIINRVSLNDYIASVVGSEMNFTDIEALKTQAVVSRTYALWSVQRSPYPDYDMTDREANQVYLGDIPSKPWYRKAAESTQGEILTWSGQLILSVFSSTCGGTTSNNEDVWNGVPHPYLRSQSDSKMCEASPHYRWSFSLNQNRLKKLLRKQYNFSYESVSIEKDASNRIETVVFTDNNNNQLTFSGNDFRGLINKHISYQSIRSTHFEWTEEDETIHIEGKGLGHGVGLCQWGARGFAQNGWDYKSILSFYFSGTKTVNLEEIESNKITLHP